MSKSWVSPNMDKFAVFILSHGRANRVATVNTLKRSGYTGKIVIIIDNLDEDEDKYIATYGNDNVFVFNKPWAAINTDSMNNFNDIKAVVFARNTCWDIAKELKYEYFCVMDDDYSSFCHKREECERTSKRLDEVFYWFTEYLLNTNIKSIAFSQGGDHIGGFDPDKRMCKRKVMNSFFCMTDRPFMFYGIINEDVNCYLENGKRGDIFLTFYPFMLHQEATQQNKEGLTNIYLQYGTYVKSFYSVMCAPHCCKIQLMGEKNPRLHHRIIWNNAAPCIIDERYKQID